MENARKNNKPVIDCAAAAPAISALHDGEPIGCEEAEHIANCAACRQTWRDYAEMKAELRLLAARSAPEPAELPAQFPRAPFRPSHWPRSWFAGVLVPRAAAVLAGVVIVALMVSLAVVVRARDDGPWFQFSLSAEHGDGVSSSVGALQSPGTPAEAGFLVLGSNSEVVVMCVRTIDIRDGMARIEVRARGFRPRIDNRAAFATLQSVTPVEYTYTPGARLDIPVEGRSPLHLVGRIFPYRPAQLVELNPHELVENEIALRRPVLLRDKRIIWDGEGGGASAWGKQAAVAYYVPGEGRFVIALEPFENATEGQADESCMKFQEAGVEYRIFSMQAITGGQQPRRIWVWHDAGYLQPSKYGGKDRSSLSSGGLPGILK